MTRTAPWASDRALARLIEVEGALPEDPASALAAAAVQVAAFEQRVSRDALQLYAGGNVRPPSAHHPLLSGQPSMGYAGDKYQAGLEALDVLEVTVSRLVADVVGARFAEVRPTSATLANLAVYAAVTEPGDTIAVLPGWAGGHLSHHAVGAPGVRALRVAELPYDLEQLDVDLDALPAFLADALPRLVVVGASLMLHPHRLESIAELVHDAGALLLYDASHVAGLVAEGRFQAPLRDGADVVTFSTYKSFRGPAGGAIVADDPALMERIAAAVYPGLTANYDIARLLPLGEAAVDHASSGGAYADACIATAGALADALGGEGLPVVRCARGATVSHHVAVDARAFSGGTDAARTVAAADVLLSEIGLPGPDRDGAGAIRMGTQTVVSQGLGPAAMPDVASVIARALRGADPAPLRAEVRAIRS